MSGNGSDNTKTTRFDLTKIIEQALSGACLLVVSVGRTFFSFLFSGRFPSNIRQAARGRRDTAWDLTELYTRPLTYACVMAFLAIVCTVIERPEFPYIGQSTEKATNPLFGQLYDWMVQGLEKGSVLGVLEAMVPVLFYVVLFTVGFCLAASLFRQRLDFASALAVAAYGVGTFCGLMIVAFCLRALFGSLYDHILRFVWMDSLRRLLQLLLLLWVIFRSVVILREVGAFSLRVGIGIFVSGVAFVVVTLWLGSIIIPHR